MMKLDDVLERWIPYRLQAVATLQFAWELVDESNTPRDLEVLVEGKPRLRGNVATIANPMIEAGFIHARALLEFLGLCASGGKLKQIRERRPSDIAVEHFSTAAFPLKMVTPSEALSAYPGPREDAEHALLAIFELTNKSLSHITDGVLSRNYTDQHLDIACRGIPVLLHNHLYAKLGRTIPEAPSVVPQQRNQGVRQPSR